MKTYVIRAKEDEGGKPRFLDSCSPEGEPVWTTYRPDAARFTMNVATVNGVIEGLEIEAYAEEYK